MSIKDSKGFIRSITNNLAYNEWGWAEEQLKVYIDNNYRQFTDEELDELWSMFFTLKSRVPNAR